MTFLNAAVLVGLVAVVIPPIIHLLNRRRHDLVDWAAMQFLHASRRRRRRILIDDWFLMLVRMGLVAILVLAVAGPLARWNPFGSVGSHPGRDVVLVFDGSTSMGYVHDGEPAHDAARRWATAFLRDLQSGDRVSVLQAKQRPQFVVPLLTSDLHQAESALDNLPRPLGGANWAAAVQQAAQILGTGGNPSREIVLLTHSQRHGWADAGALERWELLARSGLELPRVWVVNVAPNRPADAPNAALGSITSSRPVVPVGREVRFRSEVQIYGHWSGPPPTRVRVEVDGRPTAELKAVIPAEGSGRVPLSFTRKFAAPGSHLVTAQLDGDAMPGDDRQDIAVEVVGAVPVLLVDGHPAAVSRRGSDFLRDALAPARDPEPSFLVRQISVSEFAAEALAKPVGKESDTLPRVLVLSDVAVLKAAQQQAVEAFLNQGGGVLVTLGPRSDPRFYNEQLYRGGQGWLPARLLEPIGDETKLDTAPRPVPASMEHPALELFKELQPGGLASAYFPRHWKLETPAQGSASAIAMLSDRLPFLAEKAFGKGRVIVAAVPLDSTWRTNLTDLGDFVRLSHELVYYLAGARATERDLRPGQPIVFDPGSGEKVAPVTVIPPNGTPRAIEATSWPLVFEDTIEPGVYKFTTMSGRSQYAVIPADAGESVLTPCSDEDRSRVAALLPTMRYITTVDEATAEATDAGATFDLAWLLLAVLIGLLALELVITRRISRGE
jgi:Aerotolerance regulator N-terminal/von Willebrand factor type A domain